LRSQRLVGEDCGLSDAAIAPTAHYTAYVWYRLGLPYSELFVTGTGRRLFWSFRLAGEWIAAAAPSLPSMVQYLELRHRAIEHALVELDPDRVIELGAGLSRRGTTFAADRGVDYVEIDLPHMIAAKREALARAPAAIGERIRGRLELVACDVLAPGFEQELAGRLSGAARPAVVAEGLLGYFGLEQRRRIVHAIRGGLARAGGGALICDLRSGEGGRLVATAAKILRGGIWVVTRGRGAREDFAGPEQVRSFLREAGFSEVEPIAPQVATPELARLRSPAKVWIAKGARGAGSG
jgi:O-methyltransferase involved in polyketide biosynthesis